MTPGPPTCTSTAPPAAASATHCASTFDAAGRPMRTTTLRARVRRRTPGARSRASAAVTAPSRWRAPDVGSASTGQPRAPAARAATVAGADPAAPAGEDHAPLGVERDRLARAARRRPVGADGATRRQRVPGVPTSGSRNGRLRWTGPSAAAASARAASERHVAARPGRPRPGSWNHRTARPNRWVWSIVCGAPTSRSSGGRSAVTTIIGTADSPGLDDGRVEVGRRRAARGQHDRRRPARGRARARRTPATRSSWTTWTASPASARASAIGVLREPGCDDGVHAHPDRPTRRRGWRRTWPGRRRRHRTPRGRYGPPPPRLFDGARPGDRQCANALSWRRGRSGS